MRVTNYEVTSYELLFIMEESEKYTKKTVLLFFAFIFLIVFCFVFSQDSAEAKDLNHNFPRLANYYLDWDLSEARAQELAKWDVVILDMEIQYRSPSLLQKMRKWNPDIVLLVYITPQEIRTDAANGWSHMRRELSSGISDKWYLKDRKGNKLSWWQGTYLLNVTNSAPESQGERWNGYLAQFVADELLGSGLWDGVFYDNAWDNITWFAGNDVDLSGNGQIDGFPNEKWIEGMKFIYNKTRELTDDRYIIVGNNNNPTYSAELNGMMFENFPNGNWSTIMKNYQSYYKNSLPKPKVSIVNNNTNNTGKTSDYQTMRFGLVSTLLEDGYYSFDHGDEDHGQTWWYDEYDVKLGEAIGNSLSLDNLSIYSNGVWKRDFENGLVVVNSAETSKTVDLGGEYEKIHGIQDSRVNDGSIVSELSLPGEDGLILLKTFDQLNDILFTNGEFARFFRADGTRVRNGFFVFDEEYQGGDQVALTDFDGNGQRDLLVVHKNKITAWRDDGQLFMKEYPYGAMYEGELRVALGDLNGDRKLEIYVAPSPGYPAPIKIYTRHGRKMFNDWYPFGTSYNGGYSLAVGNLDGGLRSELIVGAGSGVEPKVYVYNYDRDLLFNWYAFETWFRGGVNVASGDVDADDVDEIVVGAGPGKDPIIGVFNKSGEIKFPFFTAFSSLSKPGIEVRVLDVDFDGKDDIVGFSEGAF